MDGDSGPGRELVYLRTADHDYDLATVACARAHNAALESNRRYGIPSPEASSSSSSSRVTAGPRKRAVRVRHSTMYSDRPRRSRRNRGGRAQQPTSSRVEEEDSGMVSSNDLGPMISDTSKFKTLAK